MFCKNRIAIVFLSFSFCFTSSARAGSLAERDNLKPLTSIQVEVGPLPDWAEANGLTRAILHTQIETALQKNHIKLADVIDDSGGVMDLSIAASASKKHDAYIYGTRLLIEQKVRLSNGELSYAHTWEDGGLGASDNPAKAVILITESVDDSLQIFISDYNKAHNTISNVK